MLTNVLNILLFVSIYSELKDLTWKFFLYYINHYITQLIKAAHILDIGLLEGGFFLVFAK